MAVPEQQMQHSLRIGDVILLHSREGRGYVFSETSSSEHLTLSVLQEVISPDNPDIPDIRMAAFKVLAPNKNKAQERLAKLRRKKPNSRGGASTGMELQTAEKNAKIELKNNELEQERQKGTPVLYGSVIQLLHIYSNKYVTISTVQTSKTENTNMQMYLLDHDSENCLFKILPRYKVRSVGDEVRMEDQVTFASEKTEGQYIHTSGRTYRHVGIALHENNHEINASATESGYTIKSHYCAMPNEQESIKGGSIVRLFHRELESYLVAEGSFANDNKVTVEVAEGSFASDNKVVVEEVHLRKRKTEHGKLKAPSTSSITYWQIEKDKEPLSGQVVGWGELCRIKHLPTRLYLAIVKKDSVKDEESAKVDEESVELEEESIDGEPIKEESVEGGPIKRESPYKVVLKKRDISSAKTDLDTVFRLFPVIEEDAGIQFDSYARINHPHTKSWLVARKGKHYTRKAFNPKATGLGSLQWDSAELLQIGVQDHMSYDDAFTIEEIDPELIKKFTYVAGVVPVIKAYIKELNSHPQKLGSKKVDTVRKAINELSDFIKYAHPRMKDHQKLLRNLMVLEMVVRILEKFDPKAQYASVHRPVCQACYRLIEIYLYGQSRKNENYLARFISFFEKQVGLDLNAEQMITELVRDNALIVSTYGKAEVDNIIEKLIKSKDPRFFDYLGVLCVCNDRPIPDNQDTIIKKLVEQHGKDLFYLTEVHTVGSQESSSETSNKDKKKKEICYQVPKTNQWHPLSKIAAKDKEKGKEYKYLVSQLDLFGKLCKGNNAPAVETIDVKFNYLTFEEALTGAQDVKLHPALRSKYVELIVVLYVDVGDNRAILDNLSLSFIYSNITQDPYGSAAADDTIALTGVKNEYFPALKEWILSFVNSNKSVVASIIDENNLNAEVLDLLYLLVKYGYYDDIEDINALIIPLVSLLNGKNDKPYPEANDAQSSLYRMDGRFQDTYVNRAVFNMKTKALKIMDLFFNFRFYLRLQHFIYDYKLLKKEVDPNERIEAKPGDDDDDDNNQPTEKHSRFNRFIPAPVQLQQLTSGITQQVTHVTHHVTQATQQVTHQLTQHVTDLASRLGGDSGIEYPPPPDQLKSLEKPSHKLRINKDPQTPQNEQLMYLAVMRLMKIFSLSEYHCDFNDREGTSFPDILIDLSQYQNDELLHESLHLLGRIFAAEENLFEKAIQTQLLITDESNKVYTKVDTMLHTLRRYAAIDVNPTQCAELLEILEQFTILCHLEGDENQAHKQNQKILYNTGVFSDVLDLVFRDKSSRQITSDGVEFVGNVSLNSPEMRQREDILSKCLQFLKLLAKDNPIVQERLFDRMDDLLELDVAVSDMADLLAEVFTGGQEICLKIKEQQVEQVFFLIAYGGSKGRAELLGMLQAVVKVEKLDLPLKRNQAYIIKYFSKTRHKFCNELLGLEEDKVTRRERLLISKDPEHEDDLHMLLKLFDLLASCCEGENLFIESICQNVMGIFELLKILCICDLDPVRKKPFVRFLLWVYMNTGGDKIQTGSVVLFHDVQIWNFLEHISMLLDGVIQALINLPKSEIASAKENLTSRSSRIYRDKRGTRKRAKTMSAQKNIPYVTGKDGELIPGLLIYLMEGILPLLKVYYTEYFIPHDDSVDTIGDSSERAPPEKQIKTSGKILYSLLHLSDIIKPLLSSQEQWELLHTTIITIKNKPCFEEAPIDIDPEIQRRFDDSVMYNVTPPNEALEKYNNIYHREIFLNDEFNNFVRNYELAYWGPNTALHQIDSPHKTTYSEFEDEFLDEKGDEWLPLGRSFQKHVRLYISGHFLEVKIKPYTKRIIDCLESSYNNLADLDEKERQRQDRNDIRYLHLLRALIHNQVMLIDPDLKEEGQDPALYRMQCKFVTSVQNQIQELGSTVERIVKLLTHPNDKISAEVLAFLSMLLYNGNRDVQKGFGYLMETREEKLFVSMQQRLQQAALKDRERRILLAQLESREESQRVLKDTYVTQSARQSSPRPTAKDTFSPEASLYASTDLLIDEGGKSRKVSVLSEEPGDVYTRQVSMSGEAFEMQTFKESHYGRKGRLTISDPSYDTTKRKKKTLKDFNDAELLREAGQTEDEIYLQKIEAEYNRRHKIDDGKKASSLKFKDTSYIELALRVLGLMCDGQYRPMQNYLREQPDNIKTINLVSETCTFLSSFYVEVTKDNIALITTVLHTLIEISVGNFANQQVLFNHQIVDTINRVLQTTVVVRCSLTAVLELKQSAIELLEAMCEETHTGTAKLVQSIFKGVDIDALHNTLVYFYRLSQDPQMKADEKDDDAERAAFRTYHVLVHMADFDGISLKDVVPKVCESKNGTESKNDELKVSESKNDTESKNDELKEAWNHCQKWSKSIEVIYENDEDQKVLAKVHFRSYPADELPEELIEKVKYRVNRDSPEDKTRDFLKWMEGAKKEIFHLTVLRQHWYTNMFVYNIKWRNYLLIFWTLVMNIMLMIAWSDVDLKFDYMYTPPEDVMVDTNLSGYCMQASCYNNNINSLHNFTLDDCDNSYCAEETAVPTVPDIDDPHWFFDFALYIGGGIHLLMSLAMVISYFLINTGNFVWPDFVYQYILRVNRAPMYTDEPLFGIRSLYHIVFVACSALSLPFYGYFYCVCLLHIVIDNDILQRVLRSVTKNGRSLLWVGALGLVVLYIYSVGTFALLPNEFHEPDPEEDGDNVRFCRSLAQCFISVLEYGLLDTLGLTADIPMTFRDAALRVVFFDLTFFIIVTTIGLNIVFGIIVDTFSELRDERWRIEEDKKGTCFICSIASYEFERRAKGFEYHVKNEHSMWDYIYFYLHLERIDVSDHNAIESYAYHQIKDGKSDFFPLFNAKSLKVTPDETLTQLNELKEMVAEILERFHREERVAALRRRREEQAQWEKDNIADDQ